jgi:O-antigen/teichoic acid export membrane protein
MAAEQNLFDAVPAARAAARSPVSVGFVWRLIRKVNRRIGWGLWDQAMSSISNFAVNLYIARALGSVEYGAFGLAYVTYGFALNASRGLATDPLLVRFSDTDTPTWRRAVANCTGTAVITGLATGICALAVALGVHGTTRLAFLALGLTLPGLLLQDSWRYSFFAHRLGGHAFLNDTVWTLVLLPALVLLRKTGHANVFWFVFAWGASAAVAAAVGPLQAKVVPSLAGAREWLSTTRDLGLRYLAEGTTNSASSQLRNYGVGLILGLSAVGYVQAASILMGPFMVVFFGLGLVLLPEAVRILRRSPKRLPAFCLLVSAGLAVLGLLWGLLLLVALPRGLGVDVLGSIWRPTYALVLPSTLQVMGGCVQTGAGVGLHALGSAKRSLRAMVLGSALIVACSLFGAVTHGAAGTMWGTCIASWITALLFWSQLGKALREQTHFRRATGRHRVTRTPAAKRMG